MPQFQPDQVSFGDLAGYGAWDIGHAREHMQFASLLPGIPNYDFLTLLTSGLGQRVNMEMHAKAHVQIRNSLGLSGVDLSVVDLTSQDDFYSWLGDHSTEHAQMRQILGIR